MGYAVCKCRCILCRAAIADYMAARRQVRREQFKAGSPCMDCGGSFPPECMDFDHVRGKKVAKLAQLFNDSVPDDLILSEMAKCDVVCANCHRIRTYQRSIKQRNSVKTN